MNLGGWSALSGLAPFDPECGCDQSVVGVQACRMVCGDVLEASPPLSAANEQVKLYLVAVRGSEVGPFLIKVLPHPSLWEAHFLSSHQSK